MEVPEVECLLERASQQLQVGELLFDNAFSMFEAMSAIEIGDPKLDAGVPSQAGPRELPHIPAAAQLSAADVIAIADRLFAAEVTWYRGSPLAQTVFTCLYLLEPHRVAASEGNQTLRALCRAAHAACILIRDLVLSGNVCEEEDFVIHTFGIQAMINQRGSDVSSALDDIALAIDLLSAPEPTKDASRAAGTVHFDAANMAALLCRLRLRECLLKALQRVQRSTKQDMQLARKQLHLAKAQLAEVRRTAHPHPEGAPGFCDDINRNLMAPVPSKPVTLVSSDQSWEALDSLLDELLLVCDVSKVTSYTELKAFLCEFASRSCGAVARSALHMSLLGKANSPGDLVGPWLPRRPMMQAAVRLPSGVVLSPEADLFVEQACLAVAGWCQDMCLNRSRQRRRHRRSIEDWFHLSEHALVADSSPGFQAWLQSASSAWHWPQDQDDTQGPLGCWVERECAHMLLQHLVLGFELELYAPEEFCMMFWYCDYLYGVVKQDAGRLLQFAADPASTPDSAAKALQPSMKSSASGKHRKTERQKKQQPPTGGPDTGTLTVEVRHAHLHRQLCQAHMRLAAGLNKAEYLGSLPCLFNTEEERFQQRFATLSMLIRPEPLSYSYYRRSMDMTGKHAAEILAMSLEGFGDSRRMLATLATAVASPPATAAGVSSQAEDYLALDKMAAQNMVAIKVLLNSMLKEERVSLDAARDLLINGHSSASEEENRPKPCVPLAEQVRLQAAAAHSTKPADSMPQMAVAERCDMIAGSSTRRKAFRMEWGFSQHTKYPVMRLKQSSMLL
ncbi:g5447 [Coccomyxa viridis]|uniref:G5447 protein n=1 Tax=Coccomyxa viridis TaxID=1274662 RepID=A0ABP1FSU6_9CHLO